MDQQKIEKVVRDLLIAIGENPHREGLLETPQRVAKMYQEVFSSLKRQPEDVANYKVFHVSDVPEMVLVQHIPFYSMCEHHLLPFFGKISIGYIPDKKVVGISNLSKLVEVFARRLQIQEKLTTQIADTIMHSLKPKGAMVVCEALHLCMAMRDNAKQNSKILTSAVRGLFQQDSRTRMEFMQLIKT